MDRRQQKTRDAIIQAFTALMARKSYSRITVQNVIDEANIARATFYDHFASKDDLLKAVCEELFGHIVDRALDGTHTHGLDSNGQPESVFCHLLQHLQENDSHILELLSCENNALFLGYFRTSLNELVRGQIAQSPGTRNPDLPEDFLVNHISGSFLEMVLWWIQGGMQRTPVELDRCFRTVIEPILSPVMLQRIPSQFTEERQIWMTSKTPWSGSARS